MAATSKLVISVFIWVFSPVYCCAVWMKFFLVVGLWASVCVLGADGFLGCGLASVWAGLACVWMLVAVRNYVG